MLGHVGLCLWVGSCAQGMCVGAHGCECTLCCAASCKWVGSGRRGARGNSLINVDILGLEGWLADDEGVEDDTDGPGVSFKAVSVCGVEQNL